MVARVNLTHAVGDLRDFINARVSLQLIFLIYSLDSTLARVLKTTCALIPSVQLSRTARSMTTV